jgi:hypothetical protein
MFMVQSAIKRQLTINDSGKNFCRCGSRLQTWLGRVLFRVVVSRSLFGVAFFLAV